MKMTRHDLEEIATWHAEMRRAEQDLADLEPYSIVGVVVNNGSNENLRIERGGASGTGTISSKSFGDDLVEAITKEFHLVYQRRVIAIRQKLVERGIELD